MEKDDLVGRVTRQLAELRRREGVTQEELAERLDVPVQHVSRIEGGQNVTLRTVERIAIALGMTVTVMFEVSTDGPKTPPKTTRQKMATKKTDSRD